MPVAGGTPVGTGDAVTKSYVDSNFAPLGGTSQWTSTSTGIYYNTGNVGIGTTAPGAKLDVNGNIRTLASNGLILGDSSANNAPSIQFLGSNSVTNWRIRQNDIVSGDLTFTPSTAAGGSTFTTPAMSILSGGNVGIGTTGPGAGLEVVDENGGQQTLRVRNYSVGNTGAFTGNYAAEIRSAYAPGATGGALLVHT